MQVWIIQWREYFEELWRKHWFLIIFLVAALLFDTLTTILFMVRAGTDYELHPLVRYSALLLGPVTGTLLSAFCFKTIASIFLAMYLKHLSLWVLILPAITSTSAGCYHLIFIL